MGGNHTHLIDEDNDDDQDVNMFSTDMHPDKQDAYWVVVCTLKTI